MRACTRVLHTTTTHHLASPAWAGWCESPEQGRCEGEAEGRADRRVERRARGRETEGGSVCPEPTLNRRSMGHTLEENGKWGSWRGWPGKDGIPPYTLRRTLSHLRLIPLPLYSMLSCRLILPLPPAGPAAHPPPPSPSSLRYLISFSHPPLARRASRLTPPSRLKAPGCPPPLQSRAPPSTRQ